MGLFAGGHKGDALGEVGVVAVARQQCMAGFGIFGDDVALRVGPIHAQRPFGVVGDGEPSLAGAVVFQPHLYDLHRRVGGDEDTHLLFDAVAVVLENRIPRAMTHKVRRVRGRGLRRG